MTDTTPTGSFVRRTNFAAIVVSVIATVTIIVAIAGPFTLFAIAA